MLFANRGSLSTISGGYIYNKNIIEYGQSNGIEITYSENLDDGYDAYIVDSLLLFDIEALHSKVLNNTIGLIHQVPNDIIYLIENNKLYFDSLKRIKYIVTGSNTKELLISLLGIHEDNIKVFLPGLDDQWHIKEVLSDQLSSIIIVANYIRDKGYEELVKLLPTIYDLDLTVDCYGNSSLDVEYYSNLKQTISNLDPLNKVTLNLCVSRSELNRSYIDSSLFLCLSKNETFGMSIYEALICRIPVVMYAVGEVKLFKKFGAIEIVDTHNIDSIELLLRRLVRPEAYKEFAQHRHHEYRTWEDVGNDFYSSCEALLEL